MGKTMKVKAITPEELQMTAGDHVPAFVINAVNKLLKKYAAKTGSSNCIQITQDEILKEILKSDVYSRQEIFDNGWLNFEPIFEKAGWHVYYDKPGFNETYPASFKFEPIKDSN